jgi:hypothetical protein
MKFSKKEILVFVGIALIFIALRLPGIHLPLHQDEYKWPILVNPALTTPGGVPHPPLSEFIYRTAGKLVGYDNFRLVPFLFGFLNLILIYFVVRRRYSLGAAQWSALFFTISYYSILASLMVDTDGQILPFFFLSVLWFYDSFNLSNNRKKWLWFFFCLLSIILGLLVKISFLLAAGAIAIDFILNKWKELNKKTLMHYLLGFVGFGIFISILFYFAHDIFGSFNLSKAILYWEGFAKGFNNRNFFQTGIQFVKSIFYLSPILIFAGLISLFPYRRDLKLFHIFIALGLVFYLVLFDFSTGALDRYFQFMIMPLCIIAGVITENYFKKEKISPLFLIIPIIIFSLQFLNHYVPALHPKAEWIGRFVSLKWNFLFPFTGGSGPLGFYISFLFIAMSYIYTAVLAILIYIKKESKPLFFAGMLIISLVYNFSFTQEYLFGKINGSAPNLVYGAVEFIKNDPDIKSVTVYNDNGGNEIMKIGKYKRRLYTDPAFDINSKIATLNANKGYYLEINIPRIDPTSVYRKYFDSCAVVYKQTDKSISAMVYDCHNAVNLK